MTQERGKERTHNNNDISAARINKSSSSVCHRLPCRQADGKLLLLLLRAHTFMDNDLSQ